MGVNTFLSPNGSPTVIPDQVIRATEEEKKFQVEMVESLYTAHKDKSEKMLRKLKDVVNRNENIFEALMEVTKYCTLGQITQTLFEVGGQYRRNM